MAAGTEGDDLLDFLIETLEADSEVGTGGTFGLNGWYKDGAQTNAGYPFGIVGVMSSLGLNVPGPIRKGANILAQVKLVGPDGIYNSVLKPAYSRVYQVLYKLDGTTSYVTVFGKLFQEVDINYADPQVVAGALIRHIGGGWRSLAA